MTKRVNGIQVLRSSKDKRSKEQLSRCLLEPRVLRRHGAVKPLSLPKLPVEIRKSPGKHGNGLFATRDIRKGVVVSYYHVKVFRYRLEDKRDLTDEAARHFG